MTKIAARPARKPPQSLREYLAGPPVVGQRALADAAHCNQSMISMLVRRKRAPSARLARQLHAITGVPLKMLLAPPLVAQSPAAKPPPPRAGKRKKRGPPGPFLAARPESA